MKHAEICQNNTTNHSLCPTESSQSSTQEPSIDQSYVFGVHASAIPGEVDVGDIPLPPGGKKKLNIKYSSNNPG